MYQFLSENIQYYDKLIKNQPYNFSDFIILQYYKAAIVVEGVQLQCLICYQEKKSYDNIEQKNGWYASFFYNDKYIHPSHYRKNGVDSYKNGKVLIYENAAGELLPKTTNIRNVPLEQLEIYAHEIINEKHNNGFIEHIKYLSTSPTQYDYDIKKFTEGKAKFYPFEFSLCDKITNKKYSFYGIVIYEGHSEFSELCHWNVSVYNDRKQLIVGDQEIECSSPMRNAKKKDVIASFMEGCIDEYPVIWQQKLIDNYDVVNGEINIEY